MRRLILLCALLLLARPSLAALSVEVVNGQSRENLDASLSITVTSANLMLVAVTGGDADIDTQLDAVTVAYGAQSLTAVASSITFGGFTGAKWYRLNSPTAGTANVTTANLDDLSQAAIHVITFIDASTTLKTPSVTNGITDDPAITVADTASGNIVVAAISSDDEGGPHTPGGTQIFEVDALAADTYHGSQYVTAAGANTVLTWTHDGIGERWDISGLAVQAGGGGGSSNAPRAMHYKKLMSAIVPAEAP